MAEYPDLFDTLRYPDVPGCRPIDTSREAAELMAPKAPTWRDRVYRHIDDAGQYGATADEIAAALDCHYRTSQPRVSELRRMGRVVDSGKRRRNDSGVHAVVWVTPRHWVAVA